MVSCRLEKDPFNRPKISPAINSNCGGYRNGEYIDTTNWLSVSPEEYNQVIQPYWEDKEYRLYICLKFPGRCK